MEAVARVRLSRAERRKAIAEYQELVVSGKAPNVARQEIQERYHVGRHCVNRWIQFAGKVWANRAEASRERLRSEQVARLDHVFALALSKGNLDAAIRASTEQSKLLDLYPENARESFLEERAAFVRMLFEILREEEKDFVVIQRLAVRVRELMSRSKARAVVVEQGPSSELEKHHISGGNGHADVRG